MADEGGLEARKLIQALTYAEGWAHYCEQMMLEQGYGNGDLKLRLGQLQDALLRNARYIVGIKMHSGAMAFEQGVEFFLKEGFQTRDAAEKETKRGTSDPTSLYYTLGKVEILNFTRGLPESARRGVHARGISQQISEPRYAAD